MPQHEYFHAVFDGDWYHLPRHCGGNVEVMDQTVGCVECGMNMWFLPPTGDPMVPDELGLPPWCPPAIRMEIWDQVCSHAQGIKTHSYEPYFDLFAMVHPFQFDDCHDDGDEDDGDWPAAELYLKSLTYGWEPY